MLLSSCAVFEKDANYIQGTQSRRQLAALESWRMEGRIGARSSDESWHASLIWDHRKDIDLLYLSGPFGQGALNIKVTDRYIRVVSSDGSIEESTNPEQLLKSKIGVAVPVRALRYWVLGLPYSSVKFDPQYDRLGRLKKFSQLEWLVEYQGYKKVHRWVVPKRLSIVNQDVKLKLVVDEWEFPEASASTNL